MNPKLYVILSTTFMIFAGIVLSVSTPVNQTPGISNSSFNNLYDNPCRECHYSGVPEEHHLLVNNETYGCPECHPVIINSDGSQTIIIIRDCVQCHGTIKITTWSNTSIEINSSDALPGNTTTVYRIDGTNSTGVTGIMHAVKG